MKRSIYFILLFSLFFVGISSAEVIDIAKVTKPSPYPRVQALALYSIPVTVTLTSTDLYFDFSTTVGVATITITDDEGYVISVNTIDTDVDPELYIPIDDISDGIYTLTIQYGSITLAGSFQLE
jgi:hypothetical protein